jgi:hypothetical protein
MSLPSEPNLVNVSLQMCDCPAQDKKVLWGSGGKWDDNTAVDLKGKRV